jgi:hypothetical protein
MSSKPLQLTIVDLSNDVNNSRILVFQRSTVASLDEYTIAWEVIQNLGMGWSHTLTYEFDLQIGAQDCYGNRSSALRARPGEAFSVECGTSGSQLHAVGNVTNGTDEIWLQNNFGGGAVDARVYRSGRLLATKTDITPGQAAAFQFKPSLYFAVVSQWDVSVGQPLNSAILSVRSSEISLAGLNGAATIVMSGGGAGSTASPFTFTLQE